MSLIKKIQNTSYQYNLWQKGSKIILGVSGGPDSVAMLDIFAKLAPKYNLKLIVAHVNYGLRGKDSNKDCVFVGKLASRYSLKLIEIKPKFRTGGNLENQLREIRYDFFEKVRRQNNFDYISVAHNLDDQTETFLMRVIRGAGLAGLSAMKYKTDKVIRLLLGISRKEILDYLKKNKLRYRIDKTNKEISYLRNKVRHNLISYLEKNFNPNISKTIFGSSLTIAQDYDYIGALSEREYKKHSDLRVSRLIKLHPALLRGVLRKAITQEKLSLKDIESAHIEEILKIIKSKKSKTQIVSFKGLKIIRKGDKISILKQ